MSFETRLITNYMDCYRDLVPFQNIQGLSTLFDFYLIGDGPFQLIQNRRPEYWEVAFIPKHEVAFNHHSFPGLKDRPVYGQYFYKEEGCTIRFQSGQSLWKRYGDGTEFSSRGLARMGLFNINCAALRMNADIIPGEYTEIDYPFQYTKAFESALFNKQLSLSPMRRGIDRSDKAVEWISKMSEKFLRENKRWSLSSSLSKLLEER